MGSNDASEWNLFGFKIAKKVPEQPKQFVPQSDENGGAAIEVGSGAAYNSFTINLDPSVVKNEVELIQKYREISLVADIDIAIDEIVNEFIVYDEIKDSIELDFTEQFAKAYQTQTKEAIVEEFKNILRMLNFSTNGSDIFKTYYVDGRLAYHKVIGKNPKAGIQELRAIDSTKLKKIVEITKEKDPKSGVDIIKGQEEYFIYSQTGFSGNERQGVRIATDSVAYVTSGVIDKATGMVLSFLHKAIRPLNQLRLMEDSEVIYRLVRAPERRVFYIDTNGMNKTKAEQYIKDVMARYKNKQVYDASTGTVTDSKKHLQILEDFWLPRANGGKGTEITTLPSGGGLGSLENITYFQTKLYQALNIPLSRLQPGQGMFNIGRGNEISRDEVKFSKFIEKLRRKFNTLFLDILRTQLILKGIATIDDWEIIKNEIKFNYIEDNFYAELKESEMFKERIANAQMADQFIGKYFSKRMVQRQIMKMTDADIEQMEEDNLADEQLQMQLQAQAEELTQPQ